MSMRRGGLSAKLDEGLGLHHQKAGDTSGAAEIFQNKVARKPEC